MCVASEHGFLVVVPIQAKPHSLRAFLTWELAIVADRRSVNGLEDQLTNRGGRIQGDVARTEVDEFQGDRARKPSMNGGCGEVNE